MDNAQWLKGYQKFNKSKYNQRLHFHCKTFVFKNVREQLGNTNKRCSKNSRYMVLSYADLADTLLSKSVYLKALLFMIWEY